MLLLMLKASTPVFVLVLSVVLGLEDIKSGPLSPRRFLPVYH